MDNIKSCASKKKTDKLNQSVHEELKADGNRPTRNGLLTYKAPHKTSEAHKESETDKKSRQNRTLSTFFSNRNKSLVNHVPKMSLGQAQVL